MFTVHLLFLAAVSISELLDGLVCFYFVWEQVSKAERMLHDIDPWDRHKLPIRQNKILVPIWRTVDSNTNVEQLYGRLEHLPEFLKRDQSR